MPRSAHKRSALQAVATQDFFDPAIDSVPLMNEELQTIAELVEQTRLYSAAMSARLAQGETMDMQKPAWMEEFEEFQRTMGEKRRENGGDGGYGGEAYASCGDCGVRMPVGRMVDEEQKAEESLDCEEEQAQQAGGLRYRPHGWQVEQRYKAYEMLMKGFELDEGKSRLVSFGRLGSCRWLCDEINLMRAPCPFLASGTSTDIPCCSHRLQTSRLETRCGRVLQLSPPRPVTLHRHPAQLAPKVPPDLSPARPTNTPSPRIQRH